MRWRRSGWLRHLLVSVSTLRKIPLFLATYGTAGKLLFSAKEAAYKAQYAISGRFFGFSGMELSFDMSGGRFTACFTSDQPPFSGGDSLKGRFAIGSEVIITAVEIPRSELHPC